MSPTPLRWRSALFAPATKPELVPKLLRAAADVIILDLEDAVAFDRKDDARRIAVASVRELRAANTALVAVRVNACASDYFHDDVMAMLRTDVDALIIPKVESSADAHAVAALADPYERTSLPLLFAGIESARGAADARGFLADGFAGCYFGAEDYITDMGGVRTDTNAEVLFARAQVVQAARACGVVAFDMVTAAATDAERCGREARQARELGYHGKLCIHPSQVAVVHEAFAPSAAEVAWATKVLDAWAGAAARGVGAIAVDGQLIDEPIVARARSVVASSS